MIRNVKICMDAFTYEISETILHIYVGISKHKIYFSYSKKSGAFNIFINCLINGIDTANFLVVYKIFDELTRVLYVQGVDLTVLLKFFIEGMF